MWQGWFNAVCMMVVAMVTLAVRWYDCYAALPRASEPGMVPQAST
jgi:hypothetical protein